MLPSKSRKPSAIVTSLVIGVTFVSLAVLTVVYRQLISDQIIVWRFSPSAAINNLADSSGFSQYGKFLFYASEPRLDGDQMFNTFCSTSETEASVLGCFSNWKIFVYDVKDNQLDGIHEVTAAHEMLHAAYARMDSDEKKYVNRLLEDEYVKLANNETLAQLVAIYDEIEPGQRYNELHSVIGTQIANISPELESHYSKFFSNRQVVVKYYDNYNSVFETLKIQANELSTRLDNLVDGIKSSSEQYDADIDSLNDDINSFNNRAQVGDFESIEQFNKEREVIVGRINVLESQKTLINNQIDEYNQLIEQYNSVIAQSDKLYDAIDSSLAPLPSI